MSSSDVINAVTEGVNPPTPATLPTKAELPVPTDVPNAAPKGEGGDAVKLDVSGTVTQQSDKDRQVAEKKVEKPAREQSLDTASRLVENLKKAIDHIKSTQVTFDVGGKDNPATDLRFRVIDKDSGEVVREFPPVVAESLSHRTELAQGKGLLVEDAA